MSTPYHPQTCRRVEVSNMQLKQISEKTVSTSKKDWSKQINNALWAYRTSFNTLLGLSTYQLVYRKVCHLSVELEHNVYWAIKFLNINEKAVGIDETYTL